MSSTDPRARRGEIWNIDFDPTKGSEIQKVRPAVVISSDAIGRLPIKLVAPITGWNPKFENNIWHVRLEPTGQNGLAKTSAVDALQVRSVSTERFKDRRGQVTKQQLEEILQALAAVVELA